VSKGYDKMDSLARSLMAFYGPHSCNDYAGKYTVDIRLDGVTERAASWAVVERSPGDPRRSAGCRGAG